VASRPLRVRIRGIYATALTQLALEEGWQVVQASAVIADRFGLPQLDVPPDATLKAGDREPSELVVIGYTWATERILEALRRRLPYGFYWVSRLPLHATVVARSLGGCRAEVAGAEAEVAADRCPGEGEYLVAGVVRPGVKPGETPRLSPGARVLGDYAILYEAEKPRVTVSEHVRNPARRAELIALAADYAARGLGVHWRSSSRAAPREALERELRSLEERLGEAKKQAAEMATRGETGVVTTGETVAVIRLSRPDKEILDELRSKTTPTMPWHHAVKSTAPHMGQIVDYAEKLPQHGVEPGKLRLALLDYLAEKLNAAKTIKIIHVKPDATVLELGPAHVLSATREGDKLLITLERRVRSHGVYDGLGVDKEPGDRIVTEIDTSTWVVKHTYYSPDGERKGTYYNINTPPEVTDTAIIYLDLEVDVVKKPGEKPRIIDEDKLREALEKDIITETLYKKALEEARRLAT